MIHSGSLMTRGTQGAKSLTLLILDLGPSDAVLSLGMRTLGAIALLIAALVATPAMAAPASGSFGISMQVVRRAPTALTGSVLPALVATPNGASAIPCGTAGSTACLAAASAAQATLPTGAPVVVTVLTDGAPVAIIER